MLDYFTILEDSLRKLLGFCLLIFCLIACSVRPPFAVTLSDYAELGYFPDLVIQRGTFSCTLSSANIVNNSTSQNLFVRFTIKNTGDIALEDNFTVRLYLNQINISSIGFNLTNSLYNSNNIRDIKITKNFKSADVITFSYSVNFSMNHNLPYVIALKLDSGNRIKESDEKNNYARSLLDLNRYYTSVNIQ